MKRTIILLLSLALFNACREPTQQLESPTYAPALAPERLGIDEIKSDPTSLRHASEMTSNLLTEDFRLERIAREKSLGGYFPAKAFELAHGKSGVLLWHCYNPQKEGGFPELFLAAEQVKTYNTAAPPTAPENSSLTVPLRTFVYRERTNAPGVIADYITKHSTADQVAIAQPITKADVIKYSNNFMELMRWISPNVSNLYCKYPHAYFIGNASYTDFMNRKPVYVRYYMGLMIDDTHYPNYMRPILAAVKADGTTITNNTVSEPFLQKSWPPPPN